MKYESKHLNAMVLPLPVELPAKEKDSLEFISLKKYDKFFADLAKGFPLEPTDGKFLGRSRSAGGAIKPKTLAVQSVGDFVASFVPTMEDFDRLDKQFRVPKESWDQIPKYKDYGFAVFQLKSKQGKPHPMAFKFRSRLNDAKDSKIFFPTVHIHDGEVHERESFDHTLFLQAPEFDRACGKYEQGAWLKNDPATGYVRSKWNAKDFCKVKLTRGIVRGDALVHRLDMRGVLKNDDVLTSVDLSKKEKRIGYAPLQPTTGSSIAMPSLPIVAGIGGIAGMKWIIDRRDSVRDSSGPE